MPGQLYVIVIRYVIIIINISNIFQNLLYILSLINELNKKIYNNIQNIEGILILNIIL